MSTNNPAPVTDNQRRQSPLRFLYALMARLRAADGPRIETDLALEALDEQRAQLDLAGAAALSTESAIERFLRLLTEAMADGVVTARERFTLARAALGLRRTAHLTTTRIEDAQ